MPSLISLIAKRQAPEDQFRAAIDTMVGNSALTSRELSPIVASMESLTETQRDQISDACTGWDADIRRICNEFANNGLGLESVSDAQVNASVAIMALLSNPKALAKNKITTQAPQNLPTNTTFVGMEGISDGFEARSQALAMEAYDESAIREMVVNSVFYNMQAARQDEFGEAYFPTVVIDNNTAGVETKIRLIQVYDEIKHAVTGAAAEFEDRNIIKALVDGTILKNDGTRIFPVFRTGQNDASFVPAAYMAPRVIINEGESITTAPLAIGKRVDILGLSQTDALLANGTMDMTDTVDPSFSLDYIYLQVHEGPTKAKTDKIRIPVRALAGSNFVTAVQDMHRLERLTFVTNGIMLNKDTKDVANAALTALADIAGSDLIVFIGVSMFGELNTRDGSLNVYAPEVRLFRVVDGATGQDLALTDARVTPIKAALETAKVVGYDVYGFRTNLNRRQRGQLLDINYYRQIWTVPMRSPMTIVHPLRTGEENVNDDLAALVSGTHIRASNEAVRTLIQTADMIKTHVDGRVARPVSKHTHSSALFGVSRFLVDPAYIERTVDVQASVNSLTSFEQAKDIAALLVNHIRDIASRLYRDSNFQAVIDSGVTGVTGQPTVIIGTDPLTSRYLFIDGENRLTGMDFPFKLVRTPNMAVMNKIFIAFGYPDQNQGTINPMHCGNMLWSPEMVIRADISLNGQISKELTVQPRMRHIWNMPIIGLIHVRNLPEAAVNKIVLHNHVV